MVNLMCRLAIENNYLVEQAIALSAKLGLEGASLHFCIFPKFWLDLHQSQMREGSVGDQFRTQWLVQHRYNISNGMGIIFLQNKDYVGILIRNVLFTDYIEAVLLEERASLVNYTIYQCVATFLPKVSTMFHTKLACFHRIYDG